MTKLRETKSVFYYTSSASRTSIKSFYDKLAEQGVIPQGFPHDKAIHCGIGIFNHRTEEVEYVLEGSGNCEGTLVLYKNRKSTLNKLNFGYLRTADEQQVYGFWAEAYQIKRYLITANVESAIALFNEFFDDFNLLSAEQPVPYEVGKTDCQTVVHYLLRRLTGKPFASPHGKYTLGWGDGLKSPHELYNESNTLEFDSP
ncbi:hypothetical protein [Legionella oakridgensis]|uniref:Uncharacterized protein n=1 Tax=Legionella oakridgensis TaxID=29423 RepID=A0A0W0X399_9GAMM|nr:hypothetical protein [Legionella oakridgensis]KTD39037.1 hypothetical protein Loak_1158 [Legionella oakridgensis]STY15811.1 Uncharacterised protein [Legionella longbeachae]